MMDTSEATPAVVRVFGGMGLEAGGEPFGVGGPRQRRLLALLAIKAGEVVSVDWLSEYLWSDRDRPEATAGALRTYVSRLRQSFPEDARAWLETEQSGYRLVAPQEALEHLLFTAMRTQARAAREAGDPRTAQRLLDEALELWRGAPFRELEDLDWAQATVERLRIDRLEMLEERWETALALGKHTQVTGELAAFISEHPLRERAARQYALALHRSGRTPEALRVIDDHRRLLADGTGLDPSPAISELEEALLSGDAALDLAVDGRPLRGYRLLEQVGAGAFAVVWRGIQPSVDRQVAVKQIRAELASQPDFIRRFEAEAQLVARIEHPHIVPLIDFWRDPEAAYLVMRWLSGDTLERRLDEGPLSVEETLRVLEEIGGALGAAHAHDVVHRDVKSANIMFDDAGNAFLTDFGIALAAAESSGPEAALSIGSPAYAAPEQLRREPLGATADVFSLGIVAFECLAGTTPFADSTSGEELVERQLKEAPPLLTDVRPDVPAHVAAVVARALAKDPDDRFGTVDEFLSALAPPVAASAPADASPVAEDNPYVGLRAFDAADAERFFGRRRLVSELVGRLAAADESSRALVLVGPSGSGKSSVVRAGLMPTLRTGGVPGSDSWFSTTMVPGANPFEALETALLRIAINPPASLLDQLKDGPRGILRGVRRCLAADSDVLIVFIDQLEELFVGRSGPLAPRFLDALAVAIEDPMSPLRLVSTLRADYYHRPLEHPGFAPILKRCAVDVTPLAPDELEEAITAPAAHAGVGFEPGLVARIAAEAIGQASPLPMLQHVLAELFERRDGGLLTGSAYEALGGLSGALAARAESIFEAATDGERAAMRRLFGALVDPGEHRTDLRQRVPVSDLGGELEVRKVLDRFGEARLISFDRDPATREPTVEVAHEALLREWPRLARWLEEDRDVLRSVSRLSSAAATWEEGGRQQSDLLRGGRLEQASDLVLVAANRLRPRDREFIEISEQEARLEAATERRRVIRLRRLNLAVSLTLVVALVAGAVAIVQRNEAQSATATAETAAAEAVAASTEARAAEAAAGSARREAELSALVSQSDALIGEDTEVSILLALEAHRRAPSPATRSALLQALASAPGRVSTVALPETDATPCPAFDEAMVVSADGTTGFTTIDGRLVTVDLDTGAVADRGPAPARCVQWFGDAQTDVRWVEQPSPAAGSNLTGGAGTSFWKGTWSGALDPIAVEGAERMVLGSLVGDRILMHGRGLEEALVVDARSGGVVGVIDAALGLSALVAGRTANADTWAIEPETERAVVRRLGPAPYQLRWIGIVDTSTGEQIDTLLMSQEASSMAIRGGLAYIGGGFGGVITLDLESGEVLSEVSTTARSPVLAIGVRNDGLVVAVSSDRVELLDPGTGPIGSPLFIEVGSAVVRPDGTVTTIDADHATASRIEMGATALIEDAVEVTNDGVVGLDSGRAAVVQPTGEVEIVDLRTHERFSVDPSATAGDFGAMIAFPTPDGFVAFGRGAVLGRWEGDSLVERIDLGAGDAAEASFAHLSYLRYGPGSDFLALVEGAFIPSHARGGAVLVHRPFQFGIDVESVSWDGGVLQLRLVNSTNIDLVSAVSSADGGALALNTSGLVRIYDADGRWVGETKTGLAEPFVVARGVDGVIAAGAVGGAVLADTAGDRVERIRGIGSVAGLAFDDDGDVLVIVETDGDVHLWDVAAAELVGTLVRGSGPTRSAMPWFDEERDSVWVSTSGRLLEVGLDVERWIEQACDFVGRDLTSDEWERYVPGGGPVRSACA